MAIDYFYSLTPREFSNILSGFRKKEEAKEQADWERTRMLMQSMLMPYLSKKTDATDLISFPWDSQDINTNESVNPMSREELKEVFKKIDTE